MRKYRKASAVLLLFCMVCFLAYPIHGEEKGNGEAARVYRHNREADKKIALTFDDGPHPRQTREILKLLEKEQIHATFFVVGENVTYYPEVITEIVLGGHEIGNHTFSHPSVNKTDQEALYQELLRCDKAIEKRTDTRPKLFRPPAGFIDREIREIAYRLGYEVILWSIDTEDWKHRSSQSIAEQVLKEVKGGDIILMHDYIGTRSPTLDALRILIPVLKQEGYSFVTVSELIGEKEGG